MRTLTAVSLALLVSFVTLVPQSVSAIEPASRELVATETRVGATAPPPSFVSVFAQADNFGQACAAFFQGCYYCCLGCGDLGFNFVEAPALPSESPVPAPVARAQAF